MTKTKSFESTKPGELEAFLWKCAKNTCRRFALVCLISILCAFRSHSVCAEELSHVWKASWITSPEAPLKEESTLRRRRCLAAPPARKVRA